MTKIPTHIVYHVKDIGTSSETDISRAVWTRIGAAWQHSDGKGLNILLETLPLNGRLIVRTVAQEDRQSEAQNDISAASL
jgi:hypothetical protein